MTLLLVSLLVSLLLADLAFRWLKPKPYAQPLLYDAKGEPVLLSAIIHTLRTSAEGGDAAEASGSVILKDAFFKQWYDRPRWDYFDADGCIGIQINSLGFRDEDFPAQKPGNEYRILAVGDSFTFGPGVLVQDTWVQQLEGMLHAKHQTPVQVINAGFATGSHYPPGYVDWIQNHGLGLQPDVVIIGFCLNDMGPIPMLGYVVPELQPWLGGASAILNQIQYQLAERQSRQRSYHASTDASVLVKDRPKAWNETQQALREIKQHLDAKGVRMLVPIFPMLSMLGDNYPYLGLHKMVREFCAAEGIECVDLLPDFRGLDDRELWVHPTDQHPNPEGNRIIAQGILRYLDKGK